MKMKRKVKKALYIDDDEIVMAFGKVLMEGFAQEVICKESGQEALVYLENLTKKEVAPDILFLDLHMEGMSGWDFLEEFERRFSERYHNMYIVIVSASLDPLDKERADNHPLVKKFVAKPVTVKALESVFEELESIQRANGLNEAKI